MTDRGPFMKLCQGPQLHKASSVRREGGRDSGGGPGLWNTPGSPSAAGNKLRSVLTSAKSPPTSVHDDIYISHLSAHLMTPLGPTCQRIQLPGNVTVKESYNTSCHTCATTAYSTKTPHKSSHQHTPTNITSVIM